MFYKKKCYVHTALYFKWKALNSRYSDVLSRQYFITLNNICCLHYVVKTCYKYCSNSTLYLIHKKNYILVWSWREQVFHIVNVRFTWLALRMRMAWPKWHYKLQWSPFTEKPNNMKNISTNPSPFNRLTNQPILHNLCTQSVSIKYVIKV